MEAESLGRQLACIFEGRVTYTARSPKRLYVGVPPDALLEIFDWLVANVPGFRLGTSTGIDLRDGVGVFHHFAVNGTPLVVTLKVVAPKPEPRIPSLTPRIPAAAWIEREMSEMLGVVFEGHPDPRRLLKAEAYADAMPLRRDFHPRNFKESHGERLDF